jgi:hypothetical protein
MQSHKLDLVCVDERDVAVARFCFANWSLRKCGMLEMFGREVESEGVEEELLVTGLAVVQYTLAAISQ